MKISHVITTFDPGGAEYFLVDLIHGLAQKDYRQQIIYLKGNGSLKDHPHVQEIPSFKISIESLFEMLQAPQELARKLKGSQIVISHLLKANALTSLAPHSIPHIGARHNDEHILNRLSIRLAHRFLSTREQIHVAISSAVKDFFIKAGLRENKFSVIPYGFEAPESSPEPLDLKKEFGIPPNNPCLLTAGRLVKQKDHLTLLKALTGWPEAHLILCGEGPLRNELESFCRNQNLSNRVHFAGFRNDLSRLMISSDLFVLPSLWEGFGRVLLEAFAAGCPVVASRTSAIPEVLGDTGWLFEPGNVNELSSTLKQAWQAKSEWPIRQEKMKKRLQDSFSKDKMIEKYCQLFERVQ